MNVNIILLFMSQLFKIMLISHLVTYQVSFTIIDHLHISNLILKLYIFFSFFYRSYFPLMQASMKLAIFSYTLQNLNVVRTGEFSICSSLCP